MLHNLIYQHTVLTKSKWGQIILCSNRLTGKIRKATWYSESNSRLDLTFIDLDELFLFTDPVAAAKWVAWENSK